MHVFTSKVGGAHLPKLVEHKTGVIRCLVLITSTQEDLS